MNEKVNNQVVFDLHVDQIVDGHLQCSEMWSIRINDKFYGVDI